MPDDRLHTLVQTRARRPEAIAEAVAARRRPRSPLGHAGRVLIVAADHPARGSLVAGPRSLAMAARGDLLDRICVALSHPGVNGVLGTPDIVEDLLLLLGALDGIAVFGSMNRGGLAGSAFEIDDRFTAYDAAALDAMGYEGGKMLLRVDLEDPATASTREACGHAVSDAAFASWGNALANHSVVGLVVGRSLLYPPDDDVAAAVNAAAALLQGPAAR